MKQYKIFRHPAGTIQAVKQGWCWTGCFFGFIWAFFSKMWELGLMMLAINIILGLLASGSLEMDKMNAVDVFSWIFLVVTSILFGIYGNQWREQNLLSRGFDFKGTVTASNKEGAVALFLNGRIG